VSSKMRHVHMFPLSITLLLPPLSWLKVLCSTCIWLIWSFLSIQASPLDLIVPSLRKNLFLGIIYVMKLFCNHCLIPISLFIIFVWC
jgi:hypothetical protein